MYKICKRLTFEGSHRLYITSLTNEQNMAVFGKCANFPSHGHSYKVYITLKSKELKNGMVTNFTDVSSIAKMLLIDKFDHQFINDLMPDTLTTAENIAKLFYTTLKSHFPELTKIRIYETETSWAEYEDSEQ